MKRLLLATLASVVMITAASAQTYNGNGCNFNGCNPNWRHHGNTYNYNYYGNRHRHNHNNNNGAAIGLGIVGGMLLGGMLAQPRYDYYQPPVRCYITDQFDAWGNLVARVKTCY